MMFLKAKAKSCFLPSFLYTPIFAQIRSIHHGHRPIMYVLDRFEIESRLADRREIEFSRQDRIEGLAAEKSFLNIKPRILGRAGFL